MKTLKLFFSIFLIFSGTLFAQTKLEWKTIYHSEDYYFGEFGILKTGMDSLGNLYVTFESTDDLTKEPNTITTLKFDPAGNLVWERHYTVEYKLGWYMPSIDMAVGKNGTVAIASNNNPGMNIADEYMALKYDTDGDLNWVRKFNLDPYNDKYTDTPYAVCIDDFGHVYVTGKSQRPAEDYRGPEVNNDMITICYGIPGDTLWIDNPDFVCDSLPPYLEVGYAMTLDSKNNAIIAGACNYVPGINPFQVAPNVMVRSTKGGNWSAVWGERHKYQEAVDVTTDSLDNVLVLAKQTGTLNSDETKGIGYYILKYNSSGQLQWVLEDLFDREEYPIQIPLEIKTDYNNNVIVTGWIGTAVSMGKTVTLKFNPDGEEMWRNIYDDFYWSAICPPGHGMFIDSTNNIYLGGRSYGDPWTENANAALIKLDTAGNRLWETSYNLDSATRELVRGLEVDKYGNIYLTCYLTNPANPAESGILVLRYTETTGKEEFENKHLNVTLFPNPAADEFRVSSPELGIGGATIALYDLNGRKLLEKTIPTGSNEITVDVTRMKSGIYFCRIITEKGNVTKKVVIE